MRRVTRKRKLAVRNSQGAIVPTEREIVVHALKMSGMPRDEIARLLRVSKTTIDYDLQTVREFIQKSPLYLKVWRRLHYDSLKKVEKVFQKYLDGKGRDPGGDLKLALRLAENIGLLQPRGSIEINNPAGDVNIVELEQKRKIAIGNALIQFGVKMTGMPVPPLKEISHDKT